MRMPLIDQNIIFNIKLTCLLNCLIKRFNKIQDFGPNQNSIKLYGLIAFTYFKSLNTNFQSLD